MVPDFDIAIVGAGIVGLAHALAARRAGLRVIVLDREAQAVGASVRNFGFVTVTGQEDGATWRRAKRSRNVWAEVAPQANIAVEQEGLLISARRPAAMTVLEAFAATTMGEACRLLSADAARQRCPMLTESPLAGALWSPHELRVDPRDAIPKLAAWLEASHGVTIRRRVAVSRVEPGLIETGDGPVRAARCVVCPGDDLATLFADRLAVHDVTRCKLQMLRTVPQPTEWRLPGAVMSDLSLIRYLGYARLPEAQALRAQLEREEPRALRHGVHLIVVQSADGSLVIGDSHDYAPSPDPFAAEEIDAVIMGEARAVLDLPRPEIAQRWTGTYASAPGRAMLVDRPAERVRLVVVTSGTGASTAFAIAEEVVAEMMEEA